MLYKSSIADSPTCRALLAAMQADAELAARIELLVVDNSPAAQSVPDGFPGRYLHDGLNPGLAPRYNLALAEAAAVGATWLQLLDQDTHLTEQYFAQVRRLAEELASDETICAVVPKLVAGGALQSPHAPPFRKLRVALDLTSKGVLPEGVWVYNSGALVRVRALEAIGGFPEAYWLDFLDHAIFARMQEQGGRVYVMDVRIEHEMSIHRPGREADPAYAARHRNQLRAEVRFFREHGSVWEQARDRVFLVQRAVEAIRKGWYAAASRMLQAAVWWPPKAAKRS